MRAAIIPARGGSKRIPRKNIRDFCGKPIIAYSIAAARDSQLFDHILISTDDPAIGEVAQAYGAEVPFMRPAALANDLAGTTEVIAHATQWMIDQQWSVEAVCCIYATAPLVQVEDLRQGWQELQTGAWAYVFTATEFAAPIFRSFRIHSNGGVEMFFPEHFPTRSQDLPIALHDAGQFYWGRPEAWLSHQRVFDRHSFPMVIPRWRVQDIDTEDDWRRAELIYHALIKGVLTQ
jgi:N-acylneuraminate cytidylyltransferase